MAAEHAGKPRLDPGARRGLTRPEPSRRALLDVLADGERTAGELVATLPDLTQPSVSRHLHVLREVGLIEVRPDAQRRIYALRAHGLVQRQFAAGKAATAEASSPAAWSVPVR